VPRTHTRLLKYYKNNFREPSNDDDDKLITENNNTTINNNNNSSSMEHDASNRDKGRDSEKDRNRSDKEREKSSGEHNKANSGSSPKRPRSRDMTAEREKNWNYPPGLDNIMATGAFWQNYSGEIRH
jgi:hypothetical protein